MSDVFERVKQLCAEHLGVAEGDIAMDSKIADDLGADSLDVVELVMALEEAFDVEIADEEAEKIGTVGDAVRHIEASRK